MRLRPAGAADLDLILALEAAPEAARFIHPWTRARHAAGFDDPDTRTLVVEDEGGGARGFAILAGLARRDRVLELVRIVVDAPGRGTGRAALVALLGRVFGEDAAERIWLDVYADNARARHLYARLGFRETGASRGRGGRRLVLMALDAPGWRRAQNLL